MVPWGKVRKVNKKAPDGGIRGYLPRMVRGWSEGVLGPLRAIKMSGVEEGGGEPSSGNTPDNKTQTPVQRQSLVALFTTPCIRWLRFVHQPTINILDIRAKIASTYSPFQQIFYFSPQYYPTSGIDWTCAHIFIRSRWIIRLLLPVQFHAGWNPVIFPREDIVLP